MNKMLVAAALAACAAGIGAAAASAANFQHLQPGVARANLREQVPVNVVFVGFTPSQVDQSAFLSGLPDGSKPVVRSRLLYGVTEKLGLDYTYDYSVTYTDTAWADAFFGALAGQAQPADRTLFQEDYNTQDGTRDVGDNHFIDAPTVEKWLIDHAPTGVNTRENTIFFINWWGRPDFIDHVYTKFGEPDPDTGFDFGVNRESRKIVAWGGTTPDDEETGLGDRGVNRLWFFDLSAGPEAWAGSFDVTNDDLDGDDAPDYRIPPAWEYAAGGYRSPSALAGDLGLLARYAAINLLFTTSPIYPPYLTPPLLPASINLDMNTYEGWPGVDASAKYLRPGYLRREESELFPSSWSVDSEDLKFEGKARECYELWIAALPCFGDHPQYPADANLFLYNALNLDQALGHKVGKLENPRLYEAPGFNYSTTDDVAPGFLGFADDNWVDGTQSFVFGFVSQSVVDAGYGLTTTAIHEYGHHFGMSHPHDGFDSETGIDYEPTGPFFFVWSGDESNSMMSYVDLNWDFSQFDRDNAARHQAAGYILTANLIAARILASKKADRAAAELAAADDAVGRAEEAIQAHNYAKTWREARSAYGSVLDGANDAGVKVEASYNGWSVLPKVKNKHAAAGNSVVAYGAFDRIGPRTQRSLP